MNRPAPVKNDNFFLLIFRALRHRRTPIALRIASHNVILVAVALVIYTCVMGLQFKEAMHTQADAVGTSLTTQTASSATELLMSNDILSLNVLLGNLAKNPLVAHAAIYSADGRTIAEAGQKPRTGLLTMSGGVYEQKISFQDVNTGTLRVSLDMSQFQQPMTISLQSMGILSVILLALSLAFSLRIRRNITLPLLQLRVWLRDLDPYTPGVERQDEIGDLARNLQKKFAAPMPEPEPEPVLEPEADEDDDEPASPPPANAKAAFGSKPAPQRQVRAEEDDEDDDVFADLGSFDDEGQAPRKVAAPANAAATPAAPRAPQFTALLAVQLGAQEQLRRLPRTRLLELLERYRDVLAQAASVYQGVVHTLSDGSSLILFHSDDCGDDYLTNGLCCGELLRAMGHQLQIEVADSGITLQLQLGLMLADDLYGISQVDLLLTEPAQAALALSQHSRNLLLVERRVGEDLLIRQRARIRPIASPEGACCVERLLEPYPSLLERQLARMSDRN
ncbi:AhpA/YtjB family protein [Pseudomonas sp. KNUC1026]|uniref:AhpA/YtjB family protein n=1 Tax=Pseudomonas sp. KNUC1026 TaxID=2893890 RepID=UPI001EF2A46F|nr:AhpA/YtjB family protein [Pseudomonas sp. KNUC1026]UFH48915.1 histidine kinase [Pseudomonas sp. KNUC1026]